VAVFDKGSYSEKAKFRLRSSQDNKDMEKEMSYIHSIWNDGFKAGYQAAIDRYIPIEK
jgi:hypothetical protein